MHTGLRLAGAWALLIALGAFGITNGMSERKNMADIGISIDPALLTSLGLDDYYDGNFDSAEDCPGNVITPGCDASRHGYDGVLRQGKHAG